MAEETLQAICFKGLLMAFVTSVVVFVCFFGILRFERHTSDNEMQRLGKSRYTRDGEPNPWFFFVRDKPTIQKLAALPFLTLPNIERTEKGFKVHGKDYEATFERILRLEPEEIGSPSPNGQEPEVDFGLTMVKGKTHFWKNGAGKPITYKPTETIPAGEKNAKEGEVYRSPADNTIPETNGKLE